MNWMLNLSESESKQRQWRSFWINIATAVVGTVVFYILESRMLIVMDSLPAIFLLVFGIKIAYQDVPLMGLRSRKFLRIGIVSAAVLISGFLSYPRKVVTDLAWIPYSAANFDAAKRSGEPIILDFYADWCPPCKAMDRKVFSRDEVAEVMAGFKLIRVDATDQSGTNVIEATERFMVYGFPTMMFFDRSGDEVRTLRLIGPEYHTQFLQRLEAASSTTSQL